MLLIFSLLLEDGRLPPEQGAALFMSCRRLKGESVSDFAEKFRWQALGFQPEEGADASTVLLTRFWDLCWEDTPLLRCMGVQMGIHLHTRGQCDEEQPVPFRWELQQYEWHPDITIQPTRVVSMCPDFLDFIDAGGCGAVQLRAGARCQPPALCREEQHAG